jgi:hypothetical protein
MTVTLEEILLAPDARPKVAADCCTLIEQEVSEMSGVSGSAVKLDALEPYWTGFIASDGFAFGDYLAKRGGEVAQSLLSVTDARATASGRPTVIKAYGAVRRGAARHVEAALPRVGELVQKYAP